MSAASETPVVHVCEGIARLSPRAAALFADPSEDLFLSRAWFETLIAHGLARGVTPLFAVCSKGDAPFALLPLARGEGLSSLAGPYTCRFGPLFAPGACAFDAGFLTGRLCRGLAVSRLDAIDGDAPWLGGFVRGLRRAGLVVYRFDGFGNWHEPVAGSSFAAYLAGRPGALRATVRRKIHRARDMSFVVVAGEEGLDAAISDYEAIYARSWKEPEPFPDFNPALMRVTARLGLLRLGLLRLSGQVAAAQFWIVSGGRAAVLKLAHDEAFASFSPGTILTALMIERLLASERIDDLDFGRGDDPYKRLWTSVRRQRIGLLIVNPLRARGLAEIARSIAGATRRYVRRRVFR